MHNTLLILVTLVVDGEAHSKLLIQIGAERSIIEGGLTIGHHEDGLLDDLIVEQIVPRLARQNGASRTNTSVVFNEVHPRANIVDDIGIRIRPACLSSDLMTRWHAVVVVVALTVGRDSNHASGESLHTDALTLSSCTL